MVNAPTDGVVPPGQSPVTTFLMLAFSPVGIRRIANARGCLDRNQPSRKPLPRELDTTKCTGFTQWEPTPPPENVPREWATTGYIPADTTNSLVTTHSVFPPAKGAHHAISPDVHELPRYSFFVVVRTLSNNRFQVPSGPLACTAHDMRFNVGCERLTARIVFPGTKLSYITRTATTETE